MGLRTTGGLARSLRPLLALACATCSGAPGGADAPRPTEVVPNAGYATSPTPVTINGSNFLAQAKQQAGGGAATLDTHHRAWLDDVELEDVTWVSTSELTATVPAGLAEGAHRLTVENALGERGTLDGAFTVLSGSSLAATVAVDRTTATEGQTFHLTLTLANDGGADVTDLALASPSLTSDDGAEAAVDPGSAPSAPSTLAAGERQAFTWTCVATKAGHLSATAGATGKDASSGTALDATPAAPAQVTVQAPPALRAELSIPPFVPVSSATGAKDFTVTMTVANSGGADAIDVTPTALSAVAGSVPVSPKDGPTPASAAVPAGQAASFTWTFTAGTSIGSLQLSGGAGGKDANSGDPASATAVASNAAHVGNAAIIASIKSPPAQVPIGDFAIVVTFSNPGTQAVTQLLTHTSIVSSPDPKQVSLTGPSPFPPSLPPGDTDLTWTVRSLVAGELVITFSADGRDGTQPVSGSTTVTIHVAP